MVKKILALGVLLVMAASAFLVYWTRGPLIAAGGAPIEFSITAGSGLRSAMKQVHAGGVPVPPLLMEFLARGLGKGSVIKPGSYRLMPGTTPLGLVDMLVKGSTIKESLTIIEGWTFAQMRAELARQQWLKHDSAGLSLDQLLDKVAPGFPHPEGIFYPDTYVFERGSSDLQVYQQAHQQLMKKLKQAWDARAAELPYDNPYDALIMASIVEKETGKAQERTRIASVFINRLRRGMLLQTDPTVIYGMGDRFDGNLRKQDLLTDTPYNTYLRPGLPPTPIALPGRAAIEAAMNPAQGKDLYFVARGDGSSEFSDNLDDHNRAVNRFQRRSN